MKLYHRYDLYAFEVVVSVIFNWCSEWFLSFPRSPKILLDKIDRVLQKCNLGVLKHLRSHKVQQEVYAWMPLRSGFSEVLTYRSWVVLWDHILSSPEQKGLLSSLAVAFCLYFSNSLLSIGDNQGLTLFFKTRRNVDVQRLIEIAKEDVLVPNKEILAISNEESSLNRPFSFPLPFADRYPEFDQYPKGILGFKQRIKTTTDLHENELMKKKDLAENVKAKTEELEKQEKEWVSALKTDSNHGLCSLLLAAVTKEDATGRRTEAPGRS